MSGVYVRGLEMPKNCACCPFRLVWCRERIYMEERPKRCPLIHIPDHGDLIDRDEVGAWVDGWHTKNEYYHPYSKGKTMPTSEVVDLVKQVPAVIPAERSEDE